MIYLSVKIPQDNCHARTFATRFVTTLRNFWHKTVTLNTWNRQSSLPLFGIAKILASGFFFTLESLPSWDIPPYEICGEQKTHTTDNSHSGYYNIEAIPIINYFQPNNLYPRVVRVGVAQHLQKYIFNSFQIEKNPKDRQTFFTLSLF